MLLRLKRFGEIWAESRKTEKKKIRKTEKLVSGRSHSQISSHFLINHTVLKPKIPGAVTVGFDLFGAVPLQKGHTHVNDDF